MPKSAANLLYKLKHLLDLTTKSVKWQPCLAMCINLLLLLYYYQDATCMSSEDMPAGTLAHIMLY